MIGNYRHYSMQAIARALREGLFLGRSENFPGMEFRMYYSAGSLTWSPRVPSVDIGFDLSAEYAMACKAHGKE